MINFHLIYFCPFKEGEKAFKEINSMALKASHSLFCVSAICQTTTKCIHIRKKDTLMAKRKGFFFEIGFLCILLHSVSD